MLNNDDRNSEEISEQPDKQMTAKKATHIILRLRFKFFLISYTSVNCFHGMIHILESLLVSCSHPKVAIEYLEAVV